MEPGGCAQQTKLYMYIFGVMPVADGTSLIWVIVCIECQGCWSGRWFVCLGMHVSLKLDVNSLKFDYTVEHFQEKMHGK